MTLNELNRYINAWQKRQKDIEYMADIRTARVCCIIANAHSKKRFKEKDFMPRQKSETMTPEQMAEVLKGVTVALGGEVNIG